MQVINSTVIWELSTIFFFRQLISGGLYLGGVYIRVLISGGLVSWGLISEGLIYLGHISRGLISGGACNRVLYPGDFYLGVISGGLIAGKLISGVLYPGDFYTGGLYSTQTIFKDSTCFTLGAGARFCCKYMTICFINCCIFCRCGIKRKYHLSSRRINE